MNEKIEAICDHWTKWYECSDEETAFGTMLKGAVTEAWQQATKVDAKQTALELESMYALAEEVERLRAINGRLIEALQFIKKHLSETQASVTAWTVARDALSDPDAQAAIERERLGDAVIEAATRFRRNEMAKLYKEDAPADSWWVTLFDLTNTVDALNTAQPEEN